MPQYSVAASAPHRCYRRNGQPALDATVALSIDFRVWRLTPQQAREMARLLEDAATKGDLIIKESTGDREGDRVG